MPPLSRGREALTALLDLLPELFGDVVDATALVGAAVASAREVLIGQGGRVLLFQSTLCGLGPGSLPNRDPGNQSKAYGTDSECVLFTSQEPHSKFYTELSRACVLEQVCVDVFACTSGFVDVATMAILAETTGGRVMHYENFRSTNPAEANRMHTDIVRTVTGFTVRVVWLGWK